MRPRVLPTIEMENLQNNRIPPVNYKNHGSGRCMNQETAYWISMANIPKWGPKKMIGLIIRFHHERKLTIEEFFHLSEESWKNEYALDTHDIQDLQQAKSGLPNNAFLVESLINEGYELIPKTSAGYPKTLKDNLRQSAPVVIYIKGNKHILQEKSVAIGG
jgi:DNA processing protein